MSLSLETPPMRKPALVLWLTGLSGAGKSTIASMLQSELLARGEYVVVLDGDVLRAGLCCDLGFSETDRHENIRRAAHVASISSKSGVIVIAALISPKSADRKMAEDIIGTAVFREVFVNAPIEICIQRDPKGLYARAQAGEIKMFTGISAEYENPKAPHIEVRTDLQRPAEVISTILKQISSMKGF